MTKTESNIFAELLSCLNTIRDGSSVDQSLLTVQQACSFLNIKESHLRSLVFRKKIPYLKVGNCLRFSSNKIMEWADSTQEEGA